MKKTTLLFSVLFISVLAANAQVELKTGWTYAFQAEDGGLVLGGKYNVTPEIDIAAGLSMFFPNDGPFEDVDYWMIDFDGHFKFNMAKGLYLYPLAGLNFTTSSVKIAGDRSTNTEFGLNVGGGAQFQIIDPLSAFLELKYILGDADQGVLGLGLNLRIR